MHIENYYASNEMTAETASRRGGGIIFFWKGDVESLVELIALLEQYLEP